MRRPMPTGALTLRLARRIERRAVGNLRREIWSLGEGSARGRSDAYADHYERLLAVVDKHIIHLKSTGDAVDLVKLIKSHQQQTLQTLRDSIRASGPSWLPPNSPDEALNYVVQLGVRLWLFITPDLSDGTVALSNCVSSTLLKVDRGAKVPRIDVLSPDFCEKSLTRKGGISLVWTSDLSEHLTFESKDRLRVFRHASALKKFSEVGSEESVLFPPGFLRETDATIRLLFQPNNFKNGRRNRRLARRGPSDLEAGIETSAPPLELAQYPTWGYRLAEVQRVYNVARPGALPQWWYDRRNKPEWATFWIAIVIFVLTVVFGLISSVTAIMQVYAAFRVT